MKDKNLDKWCSFVIFTKKIRKKLILTYSRRSFVFVTTLFFLMLSERIQHWALLIMLKKPEYEKPICQGLKSRVLFDIETKGQMFCIALGPVTICLSIGTIELLYLFYNIHILNAWNRAATRKIELNDWFLLHYVWS